MSLLIVSESVTCMLYYVCIKRCSRVLSWWWGDAEMWAVTSGDFYPEAEEGSNVRKCSRPLVSQ